LSKKFIISDDLVGLTPLLNQSASPIPATLTEQDATAARGQLYGMFNTVNEFGKVYQLIDCCSIETTVNGRRFQRIIPKSAVLLGYQPANSNNLPDVDFIMLAAYLGKVGDYWSPELRFFKAQR
jgi:hypothetical protein